MFIAIETFKAISSEQASYGLVEAGTVEVTIRNETKTVRARRTTNAQGEVSVSAYEMFGTYQTSGKRWPASIMSMVRSGKRVELVSFGRDDRSGRFNKANNIWFN